jgi:hypothetical protein
MGIECGLNSGSLVFTAVQFHTVLLFLKVKNNFITLILVMTCTRPYMVS